MTKIVLLGDLHIGVNKNNPIFADAFKIFIENTLIPRMEKENIKHLIQLGDVFDKRIGPETVTANRARNDFILPLLEAEINAHILIGNHDCAFKNTVFPNSVTELLHSYDVTIYDRPQEAIIADLNCVILPWICDENRKTTFELLKRTKRRVVFGHLELTGFSMYAGSECHDGDDPRTFQDFDFVGSGHFHQPSNSGSIHYLGAPAEYTWSDCDCPRGFWIFDTKTLDAQFVQNPDRMFYKLEYSDSSKHNISHLRNKFVKVIVKDRKDPFAFSSFIDSLEKVGVADLKIVENAIELDVSNDVVEEQEIDDHSKTFSNYIEKMEETEGNKHLDRGKLNSILQTVYHESLEV